MRDTILPKASCSGSVSRQKNPQRGAAVMAFAKHVLLWGPWALLTASEIGKEEHSEECAEVADLGSELRFGR